VLVGVAYPEVLVARAFSHGDDLELVLYPSSRLARPTLTVKRLQPHRRYEVTGAQTSTIVADETGRAELDVDLRGRTAITLRPH
jgi:hypothetical protein